MKTSNLRPNSWRFVFAVVILSFATLHTVAAAPVVVELELPKTGVTLSRPTGGWINVDVSQHRFVVSFFDANRKRVPTDRARGLVRFYYTTKEKPLPTALNPSEDGRTLVSPARVLPPHVFHVHIVLLAEGSDEPVESYNFRYPG